MTKKCCFILSYTLKEFFDAIDLLPRTKISIKCFSIKRNNFFSIVSVDINRLLTIPVVFEGIRVI